MVKKTIPTIKPGISWQLTTIANIIDELNDPCLKNMGSFKNGKPKKQKKIGLCYLEYKNQKWRLEKVGVL